MSTLELAFLGIVLVVLVIISFLTGWRSRSVYMKRGQQHGKPMWWQGWLQGVSTEMVGAIITTGLLTVAFGLIQANAAEQAEFDRERERLIEDMSSANNLIAREAVRRLERGNWFENESDLLVGANLVGANLAYEADEIDEENDPNRGELAGLDFSEAALQGVTFTHADLRGTNFTNANLEEANLSGTVLDGATLVNANLSGITTSPATSLTNVNLTGANLQNAIIDPSILQDVTLSNADLTGVNLTDVNLFNVVLDGASLNSVILVRANLENVTLDNADLTDANLTNATFTNVTMVGVDLSGANLSGATFDDESILDSAILSAETTMPDGDLYTP